MNTSQASRQSASTSRSLPQSMRQHPLFSFFFLAYAISWILLLPSVLSAWGILPGDFTGSSSAPSITFVLHTFGPAMAAFVMTYLLEGKAGVQRLRQRIRQRRAGWVWYLFILVGIPALILLGMIIQPGVLASFQGLPPLVLVSYAIYFVVVWFGGGPLGEEPGWRGFALPRIQPRYGPLWGTLLLGVLWAFWHLLEFLMPTQGGGPGTGLATFLVNFSLFLVLAIGLSVIFTWVFNHTQGSLFVAITAHASVDTPQLVLVPLFLAVDYTGLLLAGAIGFGVPALLIVILTRGRLGYQPGQKQSLKPEQLEVLPTL